VRRRQSLAGGAHRALDELHGHAQRLLQLGDLSESEIAARFENAPPLSQLFDERRAFPLNLAGEKRWVTIAEITGAPAEPGGKPIDT